MKKNYRMKKKPVGIDQPDSRRNSDSTSSPAQSRRRVWSKKNGYYHFKIDTELKLPDPCMSKWNKLKIGILRYTRYLKIFNFNLNYINSKSYTSFKTNLGKNKWITRGVICCSTVELLAATTERALSEALRLRRSFHVGPVSVWNKLD